MPYNRNKVSVFDQGLITRFGDEAIPEGSSSDSTNFLSLGDRIELVSGQTAIGDDLSATGPVDGVFCATDGNGVWHTYKKVDTVLYYLDNTTNTWSSIQTGLPASEDLSGATYRSPAGSFLILSSPTSGLYRINLANPSDIIDLYDAAQNFKGYISIHNNRMWMWNILRTGFDQNNRGILRISWIDNDYPYTDVSGEAAGTGDGTEVTFTGTLSNTPVAGNTVSFTDTTETFQDDGNGAMTSDNGGTGTINYTTGAFSITFDGAPANLQAITSDYSYEKPKTEGIFDFQFTTPARVAGEGAFFFQGEGNSEMYAIAVYDEVFYVFHDRAIWKIDLTEDDTNATNKPYRRNIGVASRNALVATGEGVYFLDDTGDKPYLKIMRYNKFGSQVEPEVVSLQLDLQSYDFSDCAMEQWNDYIVFSAKSSGKSFNDITFLYNKRLGLFDKIDGTFRSFAINDNSLYGGSSVDDNVYKLFDGTTIEDSDVFGSWTSNDSDDKEEELKKTRRLVVEGEIAKAQTIVVEVAYDEGGFSEVGTISGTDSGISSVLSKLYGAGSKYGAGIYGGGVAVSAGYYMKEFRLRSPKYYRRRIRFRTTGTGYANIRSYETKDIRSVLNRLPSKFR